MTQYLNTQVPLTPGAAPADGNGSSAKADNIRTYRGRRLEDLIPQIRAELGHDAIILRERQGVTGGIGGFFAQRCVEVDAQPAPRVNLYADDSDEDFADIDVTAAIAKMTAGGSTPTAPTGPVAAPAPVVEPEPLAEMAPTAMYQPALAYESEPVAETAPTPSYDPAPMYEPEPVAETSPAYEPTAVSRPAPADEPEPIAETAPAPA
jgi:hypothetical protein